MPRTKNDFIEWISTMYNRHSKTEALVDAVWNSFFDEAERDGYTQFLEDNEDEVTETIRTLIINAK